MLVAGGMFPRVSRLLRAATAALVAICVVAVSVPAVARADGDPGSDVLVYQNLFAGSDAGLSVQQQLALGRLLKSAARAGFPVRVAIIAGPTDLGAVTALWRNPRGYARFLGIELSLAYKGRLLVVMPNAFGFNWPGHANTDRPTVCCRGFRSGQAAAVCTTRRRRLCGAWRPPAACR